MSRLTEQERKTLLSLARSTVEAHLQRAPLPEPPSVTPHLQTPCGCFVTFKIDGNLRGCIGTFTSDAPLYRTVQEMAISAATRDPRFYPMKKGDLDRATVEISVLSPLERIESPDLIEVGKHGIYLEKGLNRGVLLPQVATEYGWDRETFLRHTCLKAGLPDDAWKEGCALFVFTAEVFGEEELTR